MVTIRSKYISSRYDIDTPHFSLSFSAFIDRTSDLSVGSRDIYIRLPLLYRNIILPKISDPKVIKFSHGPLRYRRSFKQYNESAVLFFLRSSLLILLVILFVNCSLIVNTNHHFLATYIPSNRSGYYKFLRFHFIRTFIIFYSIS